MDIIKFSQEYTHSGIMYYEPANAEAWELMDFLGVSHGTLNETKFDKVYEWMEKLGHDIKIIQSEDYAQSVGM